MNVITPADWQFILRNLRCIQNLTVITVGKLVSLNAEDVVRDKMIGNDGGTESGDCWDPALQYVTVGALRIPLAHIKEYVDHVVEVLDFLDKP